jgi:hypothetical protein
MIKFIAVALASLLFTGVAHAQAPAAGGICEAKAVGKNGKPLAGAAKTSFMKRCNADAATASATTSCQAKAVDKNGKNLAGAAKNSFMKKCVADTKVGK